MEIRSVAIDGPSGAGKSTIAKLAAKKFGYIYVDTGAIYRSVGLFAIINGVASKDIEGVTGLLNRIKIEIKYVDGEQRMILNGDDVTGDIRMPQVSIYASDVSAIPAVRRFLLDMQRSLAEKNNVIMDGRDIGTVVLPNAGLKIFLTASAKERAKRRFLELREKKVDTTLEAVLKDITYRDANDSSRAEAPLRQADDAVLIDTTELDLEQSADLICSVIKERFGL